MRVEREEPFRQRADHLPPAGMPEGDGIEHGAGAEGRDEAIDQRDLDQNAVDQADKGAEQQYDQRPRAARARRNCVCRLIARICQSTMP